MVNIRTIALIFVSGLISSNAFAEAAALPAPRTIRIEGRKAVTVNKSAITLSDLGDVSSQLGHDDDAIIALKKIEIDPSPAPGKDVTITASRILERMKAQGVDTNQVVYVLPRVITVTRASRAISLPEIEAAIKESLKYNNREVAIKRINYSEDVLVPPAVQKLSAAYFQSNKPGQVGFTMRAQVPGEEDITFDVAATIDEWVELPTASRQLARGSKISANDIVMARLNISALPSDVMQRSEDVVGQEVNSDLQSGEAFRKNRLSTPPAILAGSSVVMTYSSGLLEATAVGTAMEAGSIGQEIRVKNDVSKKIVAGRVIETGRVGVNP